jgi:Rod binding domain-containing protein
MRHLKLNLTRNTCAKLLIVYREQRNWAASEQEFLMIPSTLPPTAITPPDTIKTAAKELEVTFATQMLKAAGFDKPQETFGGGAGEAQFSSFLLETRARALVDAGGFGLARQLETALLCWMSPRTDPAAI